MPLSQAGIGDNPHDHCLFDSGATLVPLSEDLLSRAEKAEGAIAQLRLAAGKSVGWLIANGEVYAPGFGRGSIPIGGICHMLGMRFFWGGDGRRLVVSGTHDMISVAWSHIRHGLQCATMEPGGVIRALTCQRGGACPKSESSSQ